MTTIPERVLFLKKIHLFYGLSDEVLTDFAGQLQDVHFDAGETIMEKGSRGDTFFLIWAGKVKVVRRRDNHEEILAVLVAQDYFGEEEVLSNRPRTASIIALTELRALVLHREQLSNLLSRNPKLKPNFNVTIATHRLWRRLRFKWVRSDEVVYFLARKHRIQMWRALVAPGVALLLPLLIIFWALLSHTGWLIGIGIALVVGIVGWIVWQVFDWSNDYYLVTNQRVVWIEKVVGVFDSRQEAPLSAILSVGVENDLIGRLFDYGHVIVRTYVGKIPFSYVSHPSHAARMIEEHWGRVKEKGLSLEKDAMKDALRNRLGLPIPPKPVAPQEEETTFSKLRRPSVIQLALANMFRLRLEDGETVTYRKHWFVLFKQIWQPSAFIFAILGGWISRIVYLIAHPTEVLIEMKPQVGLVVDSIVLSLLLLIIPFLLWWIYQYVDWTNDIFKVTPDQILDIDKKPLAREERRVAPLENILSTTSERVGFFGNIFNYGTVYITVGGSKLDFQDIFDPVTVQSDIDRRRMARVAAKNAALAAAERERIAEWLVTYHRNSEEFRRLEGEQGNQPPNPE